MRSNYVLLFLVFDMDRFSQYALILTGMCTILMLVLMMGFLVLLIS